MRRDPIEHQGPFNGAADDNGHVSRLSSKSQFTAFTTRNQHTGQDAQVGLCQSLGGFLKRFFKQGAVGQHGVNATHLAAVGAFEKCVHITLQTGFTRWQL